MGFIGFIIFKEPDLHYNIVAIFTNWFTDRSEAIENSKPSQPPQFRKTDQ